MTADLVTHVCAVAKQRLALVKDEGIHALNTMPLEIVIINSVDAITAFNASKDVWKTYSEVEERMSGMKVLFIFAGIPNRSVSYNSPDLLKHLKENKKAVIFENAAKVKFFDINLNEARNFTQPLGRSDAIMYNDQGMMRVRMARLARESR